MIVDEKFIYTGGNYKEFRGYVFVNGNPTQIKDGATLEALLKREDFKRAEEEPEGSAPRPILRAKRGWPLGKPRK